MASPKKIEKSTEVVVIGAGPGGYSAAFRAADLGKKVILVERITTLGGVCLNVGCIPSKALLHMAKIIDEAKALEDHGISFGAPKIDTKKMVAWKNSVIAKLTGGLTMLAKQRKVEVIAGAARFVDEQHIAVETAEGEVMIAFQDAIIAVGSSVVKLPFVPEDPRIVDSTGALELEGKPGRMLILGGGIIGLEMATVYHALGWQINIVEFMDQLMPGADADIVQPYTKFVAKRYEHIWLKTKVTAIDAKKDGLWVSFEGADAPKEKERFDKVLVAVGRKPNGNLIDVEKAGVHVDERGFIPVNNQLRTNMPHIYAIGDVVGQPMLAHKATHEAHIAAEVIAGMKHYLDPRCIPAVAYTDPEVSWVGLTENEAKAKNIAYEKSVFPWAASGRSLANGRSEGLTKLLFDPTSHRILGGAIVGDNAGELIAEIALAIEMACTAEDLSLVIHPHPTLAESIMLASEMFEGTITDLYVPKKK